MIAISILSYETQYLRAVKRKDKIKTISCTDFDPILEAFRQCDYDALVSSLREIIEYSKTKNEELYISIADSEFDINALHYENYGAETDENNKDLLRSIRINTEECYYCFPCEMHSKTRYYQTYYTIAKKKIDTLIKAVKSLNIVLKSIEPVSISILRYRRNLEKEMYMFFLDKASSDVVYYNPIVGISKLQLQKLSVKSPEEFSSEIKVADSYFAMQFPGEVNGEQNVYLITDDSIKNKMKLSSSRQKIVRGFDNEQVDGNEAYFFIPIGTLLQTISLVDEDYYTLPSYFKIKNANLLPDTVLNQNNIIQLRENVKAKSRLLSVVFAAIFIAECSASMYFSSIIIPDKLQNDFNTANAQIKVLEAEKNQIDKANTSAEHPVKLLENLIAQKPANDTLGFTKLEVEQRNEKNNSSWIKLGLISPDALNIREYADKLSDNQMFGTISLDKMSMNDKGAKTAEISILKPEQKQLLNKKNNNKADKTKEAKDAKNESK